MTADKYESTGNDIEGALMDGLDDDPRLGHGVPEQFRRSDLDFIQMSGLTVASGSENYRTPEPDSDLDPAVPVSFYEEGVDDVDIRRTPLGTEPESGSSDEVILPKSRTAMSSSIESLKEIVADLAAGSSRSVKKPPAPAPSSPTIPEPDYADIVVPDDEPPIVEQAWTDRSPLSALGALPEEAPSANAPSDTPVPGFRGEPSASIPATVTRAEPAPPRRMAPPDLEAAESLLQQLEAKSGITASEPEEDFGIPEIPDATVHEEDSPDGDESVYNRPNAPARRHGKRRRKSGRRVFRIAAALMLLAALGTGGYYGYGMIRRQTATEADFYRDAMRLAERGRASEAGKAFAAFVERFPESALSPDAMLMAAHSYSQAGDEASAIANYERFRTAYPDHARFHRATTLMALSYERNGEFEKAVALLQNTERRTLDPDGYLASQRALGRAHAALGQIDEARSAYLRAASLEGNYTADEDYLALAGLYEAQADGAQDVETRRRYQTLMVDQLDFAMRSPGITESRRRDLKARRDLLINELGDAALSSPPVVDEATITENPLDPDAQLPDATIEPPVADQEANTETPDEN